MWVKAWKMRWDIENKLHYGIDRWADTHNWNTHFISKQWNHLSRPGVENAALDAFNAVSREYFDYIQNKYSNLIINNKKDTKTTKTAKRKMHIKNICSYWFSFYHSRCRYLLVRDEEKKNAWNVNKSALMEWSGGRKIMVKNWVCWRQRNWFEFDYFHRKIAINSINIELLRIPVKIIHCELGKSK